MVYLQGKHIQTFMIGFLRFSLLAIPIVLCSITGTARYIKTQDPDPLQSGFYLVIAAYAPSKADYAQNFVSKLSSEGIDAYAGLNNRRSFIFVYASYHSSLSEALSAMRELRAKGQFTDAWVHVSGQGESVSLNPQADEKEVEVILEKEQEEKEVEKAIEEVRPDEIKSEQVEVVVETTVEEEKAPVGPPSLKNTKIFVSLFNARNNRAIEGEVQMVDTDRGRAMNKAKGNDYIEVPDPKSASGKLSFIAEVFGYRKMQHDLSYHETWNDTINDYLDFVDDHYVLHFEMVRYNLGDIATMYNVYFFQDAAIMMPESLFEMNSLLEMMQENPNYEIKIHGHTNGNSHGAIVKRGESNNFFALTDDVKKGAGSAKQLSKERAQTIKDYLISKGIAENRMKVQGWGGKRMLYDKHSPQARRNVRVEVEVIKD